MRKTSTALSAPSSLSGFAAARRSLMGIFRFSMRAESRDPPAMARPVIQKNLYFAYSMS